MIRPPYSGDGRPLEPDHLTFPGTDDILEAEKHHVLKKENR